MILRRGRPKRRTPSDPAGPAPDRRLLAMLFADIVGSTDIAARLGDERWAATLSAFRRQIDDALDAHDGRQVKWTGDGFLATFGRPADAVRCGLRLVDRTPELGLEIRCGVHTGEVLREGTDLTGISVHAAARIMAHARPSELLVSRTTAEITAGAEISYVPRGTHLLKGVPGEWALFSAGTTGAEALPSVEGPLPRWGPSPTLVERKRELALLGEHLDRAIQGRGSAVVISGEAGLGKTSLLRAFAASISGRAAVLVGVCEDLVTARTLGPIRDILREAGVGLAGAPTAEEVMDGLDQLLARSTPTLLVVEDLHWADDGTLDALRHLCRRLETRSSHLMVAVTFRSEDVQDGHPLRRFLGSLTGPFSARIELRPLTVDGVALLSTDLPISPDDLHRLTGGNPLFVTEVTAAADESVPASVRDSILGRLQRLSPGARRLVRALSVIPGRVELGLLDGLPGDPIETLLEAERSGIVEADPAHVWFRHELVRRAVEESLPVLERLERNREVLRTLVEAGADSSRIMHHAAMAQDIDVIVTHGPIAAEEAASGGSYRQAISHLRSVLHHRDRLDLGTRASLLRELSHTLYLVNRFQEAEELAREAVTVLETLDDRRGLASALINLSRTTFWASGPLESREAGRRALEVLAGVGDRELNALAHATLARAHSNLATLGIVGEPSAAAARHAEAAFELAEALDRDDLRTHALNYRGESRLTSGDEEGWHDLERSIALASTLPRIEFLVRACVNASGSAYRAGRSEDAERYVAMGHAAGADGGEFYAGEYRLDLTLAAIRSSRGEWTEAEILLRELLDRAGEPGLMRPLAQILLGRLLIRRGDAEGAELLGAVGEIAAGSNEIHLMGPAASAAAERAWLAGSGVPELTSRGLALARATEHASSYAEIVRYLQRLGAHPSPLEPELAAPEPWRAGLRGDWSKSAKAWLTLGDSYEAAVELALSPDSDAARRGGMMLEDLGAAAALAAVSRG